MKWWRKQKCLVSIRVKVVAINSRKSEDAVVGHTDASFDHQRGESRTIDQHDAFANLVHEIAGFPSES